MTVPRLTPPAAPLDAVLSGGGEMGALMRTVDWARTPVGPVTTWPQSLRTALSILLESRFPMYVAWGAAFTQFYNDGYRPILGSTKHPMAMGRSTRETFAEIWHIIGPMFEGVMQGQAVGLDDFMLPLDRHGFAEECYFSLSYSPIRDESGGVGGVLVTVTETTERVYGERRLRMLRTLGERTTDAKTAVEACRRAAEVLGQNAADLPFARIYLLREEAADGLPGTTTIAPVPGAGGQVATLVGAAGALPSTLAGGAAPSRIELDRYDGGWPIVEVIRGHGTEVVTELGARFPRTATATTGGDAANGEDPPPPHTAMVLPIARPGDPRPAGALIVGISARQRLDQKYRDFLELVASQVATAVASARAYEEERRRAEALAEIDRTKTAFFSNVSHEFRTPLTLMLGPIEDALGEADRLPPEDLERWQMVHRNGLRLGKLVNTLLDFSRIEAGRLQATYEPTDLASLTIDLASSFRSAVERAGLRLVVDAPTLAAPAHVDRDMWEKIVLNLLSNALKFTFDGEIAVRLRGDAAAFTLTVEDTGVGIAASELPRLFERFHRIKGTRARTHEGTGIGLALVQELVRFHGGTVEATSALGVGTTFTVRIPTGAAHLPPDRVGTTRTLPSTELGPSPFVAEALKWVPPATAADAERDGDPAAAEGTEAPGGQARILLADDNADMRQYVARILGANWQVEAVADGSQALRAIRRARPDLVLSDVMMPNLDGFGLVRALRAERDTADLPIILLSARAGEEATTEGLRAGANDYLVKPFASRELVARVAAQLERSRTRKLVSAGIEAERRRLRSFLMEAPASIAVLRGRELVFELANDRFTQMVGGRALCGRRFREAFPELEPQGTADLLEGIYRTGEPFTASEFPARLVRSVGGALEEGFYDWVGQPTRSGRGDLPENDGAGGAVERGGGGGGGAGGTHGDAGRPGPIDGILIFAVDVTDQVRARRELEDTQRREHELRRSAEEATRAKDEFLAMLGHELRNPLAPIVTALHLMRLRGSDETEKERAIIERQVQHVTQLVDDLLDISRITRGKVELKRVPVELAKVVAQAIEMASPLLEQRRHRLTIAVPRHGLMVNADPVRLAQVVANLLTNAAKYTPVGGHVTLTAGLEHEGGAGGAGGEGPRPAVVVEVADDGIGITAEMLPRVFELFAQERQAADRSQGGLGLGLAIVHSLVTMHGGSVEARSAGPGQGSRFKVRLPPAGDDALAGVGGSDAAARGWDARRAGGADEAGEAGGGAGGAPLAGSGDRRILVVDDNEDAADMMGELLTGLGFSVQLAHDGPSGLRAAEAFLPEIALLDIGLPAMDGYELARRLRVIPTLRRLKMIAVTGYGQETDRARAHAAGFDRHLVKPVDALELEAMLESLVEA